MQRQLKCPCFSSPGLLLPLPGYKSKRGLPDSPREGLCCRKCGFASCCWSCLSILLPYSSQGKGLTAAGRTVSTVQIVEVRLGQGRTGGCVHTPIRPTMPLYPLVHDVQPFSQVPTCPYGISNSFCPGAKRLSCHLLNKETEAQRGDEAASSHTAKLVIV